MSDASAVYVACVGERDWVVREPGGRELGHYPTCAEAEAVGQKLARKRGAELVVEYGGAVRRSRPRKSWFARLFGG
jgi:hypothetical protein